ncbi:MAG TPA: hypothetical protein DGG94_09040, partial [Micromonosporaceae bacterium]|nr:hypothetical protein [Micromonosporaceae bacterium]
MRIAGRSEVLRDATGALTTGRSVMLYGPSGIGKSTIVDALAGHIAGTGVLVLRTVPAEVEAGLPYVVLVDLFAEVLPRTRGLASHLREALEVALLRAPGSSRPRDGLTVRIAVLELLRRLASETPVCLVIDDAQWVDEASAEVLSFAVRRLSGTDVTVLVAERVADNEPAAGRFCPSPMDSLVVEPLSYSGIAALLAEQDFGPLPRTAISRILEASGGNPLFAVELGRALAKRGGSLAQHEPLPVPDKLRALLSERLAGLDVATRQSLLLASAMARPSISLLARCHALPEDGLDAAERAQIIQVAADGGLSFRHPLLRELVYADATAGQRRAAHTSLMSTVDEPVERIRHLALGS